ncbi:diguanylate cyclase domain-containing protein [Lysobacter yangpyeongensis]|uniref:Diguanylate cyclase domain-containing protein n=1 Tax=Lysobacter yangpyeongensis TaxID=346182 RepID=A0ABW0SQZ9_9GAMM
MRDAIPVPARFWQDCTIVALVIGVLAWLSIQFARGPGELAAVWFGNGILTGWLMSRRSPQWPAYLAAGFCAEVLARLVAGHPVPYAIAIALANTVEVAIVAIVVRQRIPDIGEPRHWVRAGGIAIAAALVACIVSGLLASAVKALFQQGSFGISFLAWFSAHVVGMVIFATSTVVLQREGRGLFSADGRRVSFVLAMLLVVVVSVLVFSVRYPVLFLAYPPLLLGAFRFRFPGVAVGILVLGLVGSVATALGRGPITLVDELGTAGHVALLQLYIAGACLMTIPVALAMAERKRLNARLRESEQRYRMLTDYSHDVIVRMSPSGERLYVSPSSRDILGWTPMEMLGSRWDLVHPDDRALQRQTMQEVLASGEPRIAVYRVRHKDGHFVWIEAVTRPIPATDGHGMDIIYTGRDISRRVAAEQALEASRDELARLARVDALTGLANRRQFDERVDLALQRLRRHGTPVALMYLDVDHFKRINDTWGHAVGDKVLCSFAERLSRCVRVIDLVARLGGDEFVVVVEDAMLPAAAEAIARKLLAEMHHCIEVEGTALTVTTSIGIGYTVSAVETTALLTTADAALYAAKQAGRNTYRMRAVTDPRYGDELAGL